MEKITMQKFQVRQPSYPDGSATDQYYLDVANHLLDLAGKKGLFKGIPEVIVRQMALNVIGYYQDIIADAGVWRAFVNENRRLFGRTLPFYDTAEDYIEYELNVEDVRFMCWYSIAMLWEKRRDLDPMDAVVLEGANAWYDYLEEIYEDAPVPEGYNVAKELELSNPEDHEKIMQFGNWLYMNCYLLTPANTLTLSKILEEPEVKQDDSHEALVKRIHHAMSEYPTGPLALFVRQWTFLVLEDRLPRERPSKEEKKEHPYYTAFVAATGGKRIQYFATYAALNRFFIEVLGWAEGEEHLPQLKNGSDFVLLVNPEKGMLLAAGVAKCIADPENTLYDPSYAYKHAFELLTERGRCPGDLLNFIYEHHWLPDAHFPANDDLKLVADNWVFIARCYLQQYYVGD